MLSKYENFLNNNHDYYLMISSKVKMATFKIFIQSLGHRAYLQQDFIKNGGQRFNFFNNCILNKWNELHVEKITRCT